MGAPRDDVRGIEAATDLLVRGIRNCDISSLADLVTDATMVLPPGRRTTRGKAVIELWRTMAIATEGLVLLSSDLDGLADGLARDVGTLSMRVKQAEERTTFRYVTLWQRVGADWKLITMTWNREAGAGRQGRGKGKPAPSDGGEGM